jgi:hypothetical protein
MRLDPTWALAQATARLLDADPGGWVSDRDRMGVDYQLYHAGSGITLWVANKAYGLMVLADKKPRGASGVTAWCLFGGSPAQLVAWFAYRRWLKAHPYSPKTLDPRATVEQVNAAVSKATAA